MTSSKLWDEAHGVTGFAVLAFSIANWGDPKFGFEPSAALRMMNRDSIASCNVIWRNETLKTKINISKTRMARVCSTQPFLASR